MSTVACLAVLVVVAAAAYWSGRRRPLRMWRQAMWGRYVLDDRRRATTRGRVARTVLFPLATSRRWWSTGLAQRVEWWRVTRAAHRATCGPR